MINKEDLRIGNIVLLNSNAKRDDNPLIIVKNISENGINKNCTKNEDAIPMQNISPILLTKDILLAIGFEVIEEKFNTYSLKYGYPMNEFTATAETDEKNCPIIFGISFNGKGTLNKYLHEFQNLYYSLMNREFPIDIKNLSHSMFK